MSAKLVVGDTLLHELLDAGVITESDLDRTRRIVIDLEVGQPARLYLERYADDASLPRALRAGIEVAYDENEAIPRPLRPEAED